MNHINNLPVAVIVPTENNPDEIETLNPVNRTPLAKVATKEDINEEDDVEIAHIAPLNFINNTPRPPPQPLIANANANSIEIDNFSFIPVSAQKNITKFITIRKRTVILYTPLLLLHILYIFVNPMGILFLLNIIYNLWTLISADIRLIKANIITNIITIIGIILLDILFSVNINTLIFYVLKKGFSVLKVELYYLITLYVSSVLIIMTYLYLTIVLHKLRVLYNTLTQQQISVLKLLLKNQ